MPVRATTGRVSCRLPRSQVKEMEALVERGLYTDVQEVVADAVRRLLLAEGVL